MKTKNKNKFRIFIVFLILIIMILIINFTAFNKEKPKSGYNFPCNTNLGSIEVENTCFDCGVPDNVCPEDFGTNCKIKDPDCS